jgi:hypothetical protein
MRSKFSILVALILVLALITGCSKFWESDLIEPQDDITGPSEPTGYGTRSVSVEFEDPMEIDNGYFKSDMWLSADSTFTEYRETLFSGSLIVSTLVSEAYYKCRIVSDEGVVYYSGFTMANVVPNYWTMDEFEGPWFWGSIDLDGAFVQPTEVSLDTIVVPVTIDAATGNNFYFNGSGTDYYDLEIPWDEDLGRYHIMFTTLPGVHRYDWWGTTEDVNSITFGNAVMHDIDIDYIRFNIIDSTQITILDTLSNSYEVSWVDALVDSVDLMMSDYLGDSTYAMVYQTGDWINQVVMPADSLIYLRVVADTLARFTNVSVARTDLHHLVERETSQYWFAFRMVNHIVEQDSNNVIAIIDINP